VLSLNVLHEKHILIPGVNYAIGKVLASYNTHPKAVPLIRYKK